jgi:hypothetical protein
MYTCDLIIKMRVSYIHKVGMGSRQVAGFERIATGWSAAGNPAGTEEMPCFGALLFDSLPAASRFRVSQSKESQRDEGMRCASVSGHFRFPGNSGADNFSSRMTKSWTEYYLSAVISYLECAYMMMCALSTHGRSQGWRY